MGKLVRIKSYRYRPEAEIEKGILQANNIEAIISADDCGGLRPELLTATGGVHLLVQEEDVQRALDVLEGLKEGNG